jgi:hypothetical protein
VLKAASKKLNKLSDESANLISPNKGKLGVAAKNAALISQKFDSSKKSQTEIDASELSQTLTSFR